MLDNTLNQPPKFRTKNWIEINDNSNGTYSIDSSIKFKTLMLRSRLCDYSDAYILVKGNIAVRNTASVAASNNKSKIIKHMITFEKLLKMKEMISQPVVHWLCLSQKLL